MHRLERPPGASGPDLVRTVRVLVDESFRRSAAAVRLGVHGSTLRARVARIEAATGLEISRVRDRITLALALRALGLEPEPADVRSPNPPIPDEGAVSAVADRLNVDVLAEAVAASYVADHPSFAKLPPEPAEAALTPGVRDGIVEALDMLRDPRPLALQDIRRPDERILQHLRLGVTPEDMLNGLGTAGRMLWAALLDEATDDERPHLGAAAGRMLRYIGTVSRAAKAVGPGPEVGTAWGTLIDLLLDEAPIPIT